MPIHEYQCQECNKTYENLTTKMSDVVETVTCKCGGTMTMLVSQSHFRFGKLFTVPAATIHDKDGHESLGLTGEQAENSERMERDKRQYLEEGKGGVGDFAISQAPVLEE
jgi:putative FmdB family regulatory protein